VKFKFVVDCFERLEKTTSRLEMAQILSELFKECPEDQIDKIVYFCQGYLGAKYKTQEMNVGLSNLLSVASQYLGQDVTTIKKEFNKLGDIGLLVEKTTTTSLQKNIFQKQLDFLEVYETFQKISSISGKGAIDKKIKLFKYILFNCNKQEAKYVLRFPISFRLGFGDSTIIDGLSLLYNTQEDVKKKITSRYLVVSDLGLISKILRKKGVVGINNLKITIGIPIKSALCERAKTFEEIVERLSVDKKKFFVDIKVDGFRQQIHKKGNEVKIFTRNEIDVTDMFPDVVENIKNIQKDFIIDCEAIGYDKKQKKHVSFQITMQRKRKYNLLEKSEELPLYLKVFDVLFFEDKETYTLPFYKRRKILENNFNISEQIKTTEIILTNDVAELERYFTKAIDDGLEGIIAKDPNAPYTAGARGYSWIKFKKSYINNYDTIDAIVVGYFYGQGKRTELGIGALLVALYDKDTNKYYTIAKVGSGLTDEIIKELSIKFNELKIKEKPNNVVSNIVPDFYVFPKIIVEINYDEITNSVTHTAKINDQALALRFPRLVKIRYDKDLPDNLQILKKLN
jgi:DNA ligase 1